MTVKAIRVSKTSLKPWALFGPIDQALKTSAQAESVRVFPLQVMAHGQPVELELWINAEEACVERDDEINPPAVMILQQNELRRQGIPIPQSLDELESIVENHDDIFDRLPMVQGPAILTGAGGTDVPDGEELGCVLLALVGRHDDESD